jgi:hypothetical protein
VNRRTIHVNTDGVSATDFNLSDTTREHLYQTGQDAARAFLTLQGERARAQELAAVAGATS